MMVTRGVTHDRWFTQLIFYWKFFGRFNMYAILDGVLEPIVKVKEVDIEIAMVWLEKTTNEPVLLKASAPIYVSNEPMIAGLSLEELNDS